jgi:hypothetical protein
MISSKFHKVSKTMCQAVLLPIVKRGIELLTLRPCPTRNSSGEDPTHVYVGIYSLCLESYGGGE